MIPKAPKATMIAAMLEEAKIFIGIVLFGNIVTTTFLFLNLVYLPLDTFHLYHWGHKDDFTAALTLS